MRSGGSMQPVTRLALVGVVAAAVVGAGTAPASAAIECGDTITEDTKLKKDLQCGPGSDALFIGTSGITLDLDGHKIQGSGANTAAVRVVGAENTKVVDGRIRGFANAVFVDTADNLSVRGLDIRGADSESIELIAVNDAAIAHNVIRGSDEGYHVEASGASSRVRVSANEMEGGGIEFTSGNRFRAVGNKIRNSAEEGVYVTDAADVEVNGNEITGSSLGGVVLTSLATDARVEDNLIERAGGGGVVTSSGAEGVRVIGNRILFAKFNGMYVFNNTEAVLRRNVVKRSESDGIHVEDDDTLIEDNRAIRNGQQGIDSTSANGSGNIARHNGLQPQCTPSSLCD